MWKRFFVRAQPLFLAVAALFMVLLLRSQWATLRNHSWRLHAGWLLLSGVLMLASWALEVGIWRQLLRLLAGRLPYSAGVRIWFLSAIVRYIPGNIWQPLSMTLYCQRYGIRPEITFTSVMLYQLVTLLAVGPIAAIYFAWSHNWGLLTQLLSAFAPWLIGLGLLPVVLFLARPAWLTSIINWLLYKVGREPLTTQLSSQALLQLLLLQVVNWFLWGASFAALTFALGDYDRQQLLALTPHLLAVYPIAYALGLISFITPSGFGVREGAFYLFLAPVMDGGVVTIAALAMRVWTMFGEACMAGISALLERTQPLPASEETQPQSSLAKGALPEGSLSGEPT